MPGPLNVNFHRAEFIPSTYAQHVLLQTGPDEVIISFYEADFPILLSPTDQDVERIKKQGIDAECVARVVMPKGRFLEVAKAFNHIAEGIRESHNADNK